MFFRFGAALLLVVSVALAGTALETQNLALKRSISRQHYRLQVLIETQTTLRLESQKLGAPARLFETLESGEAALSRPAKPVRSDPRRAPLSNWDVGPAATSSPIEEPRADRSVVNDLQPRQLQSIKKTIGTAGVSLPVRPLADRNTTTLQSRRAPNRPESADPR